jgi:uncharacterized RDD family membrane protein YckC
VDIPGIGETPGCNSLQPETGALYSQPMGAYCSRCGTQNSSDSQFCIHCGCALGTVPTVQPTAVVTAPRYGGFWVRVIAAIVDAIIVQVVVVPISFIVGMVVGVAGVATHSTGSGIQLISSGLGGLIGLVGDWLYGAMMESSVRQATLGKMIFGMKVTDLQGRRISFGRATGRHFAKILSALTLCIGFIMAGFTEKKQALHDMIAGTLVRLP